MAEKMMIRMRCKECRVRVYLDFEKIDALVEVDLPRPLKSSYERKLIVGGNDLHICWHLAEHLELLLESAGDEGHIDMRSSASLEEILFKEDD